MQAIEVYNRIEPRVEPRAYEEQSQELQDAVLRSMPPFRKNAFRYLSNAADAEDAVQDALLSAYKHLDQFRGQAQLSTWLTAIVVNCARMQLRKRPRAIHLSLDEPIGNEQEYSLSEVLADNAPILRMRADSPRCVRASCISLSSSRRHCEQILGLAEGTIKAQLARARAKLTKLLRRALGPTRRGHGYRTLPSVVKQ